MKPDTTLREDAISFGQIDARAEEERLERDDALREGDVDPDAQPIGPGDGDLDEVVDSELDNSE